MIATRTHLVMFCAAAFALAAPTASHAAVSGLTCVLVAECPASAGAAAGDACANVATSLKASTRTSVTVRSIAPRHKHRAMIAAANAVHTDVHSRRHRHAHGAHPAVRATLTGAAPYAAIPLPMAPRPMHHPARSHAALPHVVTTKPHRSDSRGGTPYALGNASLSVGLGASQTAAAPMLNDHVTNPAKGWLEGRGPPRGDPLSDSPPAFPRRTIRFLAVRPSRLDSTPRSAAIDLPAFPQSFRRGSIADASASGPASPPAPSCSPSDVTSRRALEGGSLGPFMPSWRCST
jgi:hypothetical protein